MHVCAHKKAHHLFYCKENITSSFARARIVYYFCKRTHSIPYRAIIVRFYFYFEKIYLNPCHVNKFSIHKIKYRRGMKCISARLPSLRQAYRIGINFRE